MTDTTTRATRDRTAFEAVKPGDIFVEMWGYDETRASFYRVVGKTKAMVKVIEIGRMYDGNADGPTAWVVPAMWEKEGKPMTKRVRAGWDGEPRFSIKDGGSAGLWDGKPVAVTGPRFGR